MILWHGVRDGLLMGWQVWWALVLGFLISAVVQAWVPRARIEAALAGNGVGPVSRATALGAASSSCSYAAAAIGKSLFQRGASAATTLAFQFASTNLVWELGFVLWVLIGWQFTLAEYLGGIVMVAISALLVRVFISPALEAQAREHAVAADSGHVHHSAGGEGRASLSDVAHNFRGDWQMLWKEIALGLLASGFVAQLNNRFWHGLFLNGSPGAVRVAWSVLIGPLIAVASSVCSVGNVPLAAVLWSGGISFAGVIAFIFADLLIIPLVAIYRKYYGGAFAARIVVVMFLSIVVAALVIQLLFGAIGAIPGGPRPLRADVFGSVRLDYKLVLNVLAAGVFTVLIVVTLRRGATDPICGMTVDRGKALSYEHGGRRVYFCGAGCRGKFIAGVQERERS
jgi:uncharacterized protein